MSTQNAINLSAAGVVSYNGTGTFTGSLITQNAMIYGGAANALVSTAAPTDGQILIGSTGVAPVLSVLTPGTGITITNGPGSITINSSNTPSNFPYTVVTGATQTLSANNGYIANAASGRVTFTLPAVSAVGDFIQIDGLNTGSGWTINQGTGQRIQLGASLTTVTTGSLASTNVGDCVGMVCAVANLTWLVEDCVGNITVV